MSPASLLMDPAPDFAVTLGCDTSSSSAFHALGEDYLLTFAELVAEATAGATAGTFVGPTVREGVLIGVTRGFVTVAITPEGTTVVCA